MKTLRASLTIFAWAFLGSAFASATPFESATLTFMQHDVSVAELELLEVDADGRVQRRPAELNQAVPDNQAVLTGRKSRAELTLNDGTIARVGQLSSFTYGTPDERPDPAERGRADDPLGGPLDAVEPD